MQESSLGNVRKNDVKIIKHDVKIIKHDLGMDAKVVQNASKATPIDLETSKKRPRGSQKAPSSFYLCFTVFSSDPDPPAACAGEP